MDTQKNPDPLSGPESPRAADVSARADVSGLPLPAHNARAFDLLMRLDSGESGVKKLDVVPFPQEEWIQVDAAYDSQIRAKEELYRSRSDDVYRVDPTAADAAHELLSMLVRHMPDRFARLFALTETGITTPRLHYALKDFECDPLKLASLLVQEDLVLMVKARDGRYRLLGGSLAFPSDWSLREKFGLSFAQIHSPVPLVVRRLGEQGERMLDGVKAGRPLERVNMLIQFDDRLTVFPGGRSDGVTDTPLTFGDFGSRVYLRNERQTFVPLPASGAVVFGIKTAITRFDAIPPKIACKLAALFETFPPEYVEKYRTLKGADHALAVEWLKSRGAETPC